MKKNHEDFYFTFLINQYHPATSEPATHIKGSIIAFGADGETDVDIGAELYAIRILPDDLSDHELSMFDAADIESRRLYDIVDDLWGADRDHDGLEDSTGESILYVSSIQIPKPYRGLDLGLHFLHACIRAFPAEVTAIIPGPILEGAGDEEETGGEKKMDMITERKLRKYWARMGFSQISGGVLDGRLFVRNEAVLHPGPLDWGAKKGGDDDRTRI